MSDDTEAVTVVCMRQADGDPHVASVPGRCSTCRMLVWMSPATDRAIRQRPGSRTVCTSCAALEMELEPGPVEVGILPESIDEIRAFLERERE